ncbi:recombination protein O N-terminal domain-containing protein [Candidatus Nomurabacteria bacterium]|nr:recombination protein O N-terminal domain-containing protein [Candidatus Nomurabacteria bacterium]
MSHTIYNTEAFVLSSRNVEESDKMFELFTRDFGVISAKATGIRKIESKVRFAVQDFRYADISLVKGKMFWRLISARPIHELNSVKSLTTPSRIRSLSLVRKLAPREEAQVNLFNELVLAYSFSSQFHPKDENLESLEALLALKILYAFGYWGDDQGDKDFVTSPFSEESIKKIFSSKKMIIKELNKSLRATQLM